MNAALRRLPRAALAVPLFWKILVANAAVVVAAAVLGGLVHASPGSVAALAVAGVSLSLLVNAALLRLALEPLASLERAAARVQNGDMDARATESPLADPAFQRLARTFNAAFDELAASRRRVRFHLARTMEAEEAERCRVAEALEEDAAQRLAGLLLRLRLLARDPDRVVLSHLLEESTLEITRALEIIRGYAGALRPAVLAELGLEAAIQAEAQRILEESDVKVSVAGDRLRRLAPDLELVLYRVLVEGMEDAVRHGGARFIDIHLSNGEGRVTATLVDDGGGFDPALGANGRGQAFAFMRERAESVGGALSVWSMPDRGTRLSVEIPA